MTKIAAFHLEGLIALYNPIEKEWTLQKKILKTLKSLKKYVPIVLISDLKKDKIKSILGREIKIFSQVYRLRKFPFEDKIKAFNQVSKDFNTKNIEYFIGNVIPPFEIKKILRFTYKIQSKKIKEFNPKKNFKNCLISLDLDGTLTDISTQPYDLYRSRKSLLESKLKRKLSPIEFVKEWEKLPLSKLRILKQRSQKDLSKNESLCNWVEKFLKGNSKKNILIIFSATPKKRIDSFLKKHHLTQYIDKVYSAQDNFNTLLKNNKAFTQISQDFKHKPKKVHIGDQYYIDYIESRKSGFIPFLADNTPFKKIPIKRIKEVIKKS